MPVAGKPAFLSKWIVGGLSALFLSMASCPALADGLPLPHASEALASSAKPAPINPRIAQRGTRVLHLANGLEALLTYDPDAGKSAVALAVGGGISA